MISANLMRKVCVLNCWLLLFVATVKICKRKYLKSGIITFKYNNGPKFDLLNSCPLDL